MNKVIIVGRLTADPELRHTQSGISSCRFNVAVNRKFKNSSGEYEADFIPCVAWKQTAEFVSKYFSKGSMIGIEGSLRTGSYKDKNHPDVTHYTTDLYVDNVEFVGSKNANNGNASSNSYTSLEQKSNTADNNNTTYGNLNEFEEILSDNDVPF